MRRVFALGAVLLMSGIVTVAANAERCSGKRCCQHAAAVSLTATSCCGETTCAEQAPSVDPSSTQVSTTPAPVVPAATSMVHVAYVAPRPLPVLAEGIAFGTPPTSRRLASLSTLLI